MKRIFTLTIVLMALTACTTPQVNMPNPASVYCEQNGNKLEIQTASDGSQSGVCIFQMAAPVTSGIITGESVVPQQQ
jgi:putative hemolysin